jgi:hypothetical protein
MILDCQKGGEDLRTGDNLVGTSILSFLLRGSATSINHWHHVHITYNCVQRRRVKNRAGQAGERAVK